MTVITTTRGRRAALGLAALALTAGGMAATTTPAQAATARNGVCEAGEFCYSYNSGFTGSISDFTESVADLGDDQPSCYEFKSSGNGQGLCVKNNAAAVRNNTGQPVTVYYNSGYSGVSQTIPNGATVNLVDALKNDNASHRIGDSGSSTGSTLGAGRFVLPFPCGETWEAGTRTNHNPVKSVDFNHYPDDEGWKVYASAPGRVSRVTDLGGTSYGKYIVIDHGSGWQTLYAHLSAQNVYVGQSVTEKTMIGRVGNTGGSYGAHLHYEQKLNGVVQYAKFVDGNAFYYGKVNLARRTSCPVG